MDSSSGRPPANVSSQTRRQLIEALRTIERLRGEAAAAPARGRPGAGGDAEPVAIVGLACRMPGADSPEEFWRLLAEGTDATREFPLDRGDARAIYDADPDVPGRAYSIRGGFLDRVDEFDPAAFGISPREAVGIDPQHRLMLEVVWEALERAGYAPDSLQASRTGVYLGVTTTDYVRMRQQVGDPDDVDGYQLMGEPSFLAGRVAYTLGLRGPAKVMDTACSSSLVALHEACQALRLRECDMALVGGVNLMLMPYGFLLMSKFRALSPDGRCKTFDASADGYGRGEGAGVVVLRRLADAERDGDRVLAVVRGSAINHDGRSSGITVPNPTAQQEVIQAALAQAGTDPADVDYVEAHGTGTSLGDPIELRALQAVLARHRPAASPLLVSSVKTNIGHLEAAAGIAGVIKLVLALNHGHVPPHLHLTVPNPNVDWDRLNIRVPVAGEAWPASADRPRIGAVSSFGASGTNAHAIIAAPPPRADAAGGGEAAAPPVETVVVTARGAQPLAELAGHWAEHLASPDAAGLTAADLAFTSQSGRARASHGLAVSGSSVEELAAGLAAHARGERAPGLVTGTLASHRAHRVAWLFTGQGAQYAGMGRELIAIPAFRAAFDECAALADPLLDRPLRAVVWPGQDVDGPGPAATDGLIDSTRYTQPALFALEYALARTWMAWGLRPAALAGHSVGEIVAACLAGVLSLPDAVTLVCHRAALMADLPAGGVMVTLTCDERAAREAVAPYAATVAVAAVNGPQDVVVAGPADDVDAVVEALRAGGTKSRRLTVSHAFHSPLVRPMLDRFAEVLAGLSYQKPTIPLISNLTGLPWSPDDVGPHYWVRHAESPVRFADAVRSLHADGIRTFLELGPHPVLSGLGARTLDDPSCLWIHSLRRGREDQRTLALAAGALHLRGLAVDWDAVREGRPARRVPLPTTPWQRERFWFRVAAPVPGTPPAPAGVEVPALGRRLRTAAPTYEFPADAAPPGLFAASPAAADHPPVAGPVALGGLIDAALAAARDALGGEWSAGPARLLDQVPAAAAAALTVQLVLDRIDQRTATVSLRSIQPAEEAAAAPWRTHGTVELRRVGARYEAEPARDAPSPAAVGVDVNLTEGASVTWATIVAAAAATATATAAATAAAAEAAAVAGGGWEAVALDAAGGAAQAVRRLRLRPAGPSVASGSDGPGGEPVDVDLLDASGRAVGALRGLRALPAADRPAPPAWEPPRDLLYRLEWTPSPAWKPADVAGQDFLLLADRGGLARRLAVQLTERGARCRTVDVPTDGSGARQAEAEAAARALRDWRATVERTGTAVLLTGLDAPRPEATTPDSLREARSRAELLLISIVRALAEAPSGPPVRVSVVTRGAQPASADQRTHTVAAAPLWGLARVVALEHQDLWGRAVDLDPDAPTANTGTAPADATTTNGTTTNGTTTDRSATHGTTTDGMASGEAAALADLLTAADGEDQQALRGGRRLLARLHHRPRDPEDLRRRPDLRADGSYLVTGGLGGIGLALGHWLAAHGAGRVVLVGRTLPPDRSRWDDPDLSPAARTRVDGVRAIEALGAEVELATADVTDRDALAAAVASADDAHRPLRGVVHAAGVSLPRFLREINDDEYEVVWEPKVVGGWLLHQLTAGADLDFFLSLSSIASVWGSQHLASYAAANGFLDGLAFHRRAEGRPALTTNWGPWNLASGLFGDDVTAFLRSVGLRLLPADQCLAVLGSLLRSDETQAVVCAADWSRYKSIIEARSDRPILAEIEAEAHEVGDSASSAVLAAIANAGAAARFDVVDTYVRRQLAEILQLTEADLAGEYHLLELGLDSLMVMELVSRTRKDLAIELDSKEFFATDANDWARLLLRCATDQHDLGAEAALPRS
ncbi:type I polyketide synthase [Frankia sp. AgB32]|uniref:type I polyketide synthase n=1 Tax=Frankia sp. AgB32 TaxID=631119 RepID=UPI00200FAE5A|nr:type I polyketide synthase [Frankia sp. AgB32]MCK9897953.1 type I polyketide synthase [Frankia sp. AgB32]